MKNIEALKQLSSFNCTENYFYLPLFPAFYYTDGVKFLAQNAECYWLLDELALAQSLPEIRNDESLQGMQFWKLKKTGENTADLICERDSDDVAWTKKIEFTDFPFEAFHDGECRIWVAPTMAPSGRMVMVGYLPSEH